MAKIKLKRENCISCGSCEALAPKFFKMGSDGKIDLIGGLKEGDLELLEIQESDLEEVKNASDACAVDVIKISKDN